MESKQFINIIAKRLNLESSTAEKLVEGFVDVVAKECGELNRVAIPGFGSFVGVKHDEKIVRDLTSGNRLLLPPAIELEFVAGGRLKHEVGEDHQA